MKGIYLLFLFLLINKVYGQDFSFGKITNQDFQNSNTNSDAIVLQEFGKAAIEYHSIKKQLVLKSYYHTKILILNKEGFKHADFSIPLYRDRSQSETLEAVKGITYNLIDGKIDKLDLQKTNILTEKSSDRLNITKIAFPNIKEGSIIELRYTVESPYLYNLQTWDFATSIPKLYSEFVTDIPNICTYNVNMKGGIPLTDRKVSNYDTKIETSTGEIPGVRTTYIMKDIPAFIEEEYMTASRNFTSRLSFELASFSIPFGPNYNYTRTWSDVEKTLKESDNFGKEIKRKNIFKDIIPTITTADMNEYEKANKIFEYIRSQIKWNKQHGIFADQGVKKALETKNGNTADINFALICALQAADLEAYPIILSTRSNGFPSFTNPTLSDYNYTIVYLRIGESYYLLDASDRNTSFGLIPHKCINYQGRIILPEGSDWINLTASVSSKVTYHLEGVLKENGTVEGQLSLMHSGYSANNKRAEIKDFNSMEEYIEKQEEKYTQFKITKTEINNLDNPNYSLIENYQINSNSFANTRNNTITFNPVFIGRTTQNPFNLDERSYPVDLGSAIETEYFISLEIPEGYVLDENFKNTNMALPNKDARYIYIAKIDDGKLIIRLQSSINKPLFLPDEYLDLKEFYSRIIQSQKIDLVLKKS